MCKVRLRYLPVENSAELRYSPRRGIQEGAYERGHDHDPGSHASPARASVIRAANRRPLCVLCQAEASGRSKSYFRPVAVALLNTFHFSRSRQLRRRRVGHSRLRIAVLLRAAGMFVDRCLSLAACPPWHDGIAAL